MGLKPPSGTVAIALPGYLVMDALEEISASTGPVTVTFEQHLGSQNREVKSYSALYGPNIALSSTTCLDKDFTDCQFFIPRRKLLHGLRVQSL